VDDAELTRRSLAGFAEAVVALGRWGVGPEAVVRRPDAVGARVDAAGDNHWLDAAIVPAGAIPPADGPDLPHCLWTLAPAVPDRVEDAAIAMPCLGLELEGAAVLENPPAVAVERPSLATVGEVNDRAYGQGDRLRPLVGALRDDRVQTHGLREGDDWACVTLTLQVGDDLSVQYVATEERHRRRGLASRLLVAILASARAEGLRTATLQASPDGLPVYERLGFRRVATLRAFRRP
jgi:ribosomal protein S18 acetylase RimI-like enzyme